MEKELKVGDKVRISFEGNFHQPTHQLCTFVPEMQYSNGLDGEVMSVTESDGGTYYDVQTNQDWWCWHPDALKKVKKWQIKKQNRKESSK